MGSGGKPSCEQITDIFPDPFVVINRDHRIVAANSHYLKHYGYNSPQEVVGRRCHEISHRSEKPCSHNGEHCPLETVFRTGQPAQVMHVHYDRSGGEEYCQLHSTPLVGPDGDVLYVGETIYPVSKPGDDQILIGRSRPMLRMISLLQRVAPTPTTVLLLGEKRALRTSNQRTAGGFMTGITVVGNHDFVLGFQLAGIHNTFVGREHRTSYYNYYSRKPNRHSCSS